MAQNTGDGKVVTDGNFSSPGVLKATLYNFDINGSDLKAEHKFFLKTHVFPLLKDKRGNIWLRGRASRAGAVALNQRLSEARASAAVAYLRSLGVLMNQMQPEAVGEDLSAGHSLEDERDRCVDFIVLPSATSFKPPPKRVPKKPPVSDAFKIRMNMQLSGGAYIFELGYCIFEVWDYRNRVSSFYKFWAGGLAKGFGAKIALTFTGPWNAYRTTGRLSCNAFSGRARFGYLGGLDWSWNTLEYHELPNGITLIPKRANFNTGFTAGAGVGVAEGRMDLVDKKINHGVMIRKDGTDIL